jgi:hypothetical protein
MLGAQKGRKQTLGTLNRCTNGPVVRPLFETIEKLEENVKSIEQRLRILTDGDRTVEPLMTIPGCGEICARTIRAYTDDINRFASPKKYVSFAGLAPRVQNSNEAVHHGKITKRGPKELRTALVRVVTGIRRMKEKTLMWRLMQRHEAMKKTKIPGKAIIATARKITVFIWHMLSKEVSFDVEKMVDKKLEKKSEVMSQEAKAENAVLNENEWEEKPAATRIGNKSVKKPALPGKKRKVG